MYVLYNVTKFFCWGNLKILNIWRASATEKVPLFLSLFNRLNNNKYHWKPTKKVVWVSSSLTHSYCLVFPNILSLSIEYWSMMTSLMFRNLFCIFAGFSLFNFVKDHSFESLGIWNIEFSVPPRTMNAALAVNTKHRSHHFIRNRVTFFSDCMALSSSCNSSYDK